MSDQGRDPFSIPITWDFQLERQNFIVRYGTGGGDFWKQVILQPDIPVATYPIKRITRRTYDTAQRLASVIG